jgi:hypothetical protein
MPAAFAGGSGVEEMHEKVTLVFFGDAERHLVDALSGRIAGRDLDAHRIAQHARSERPDVLRVGR